MSTKTKQDAFDRLNLLQLGSLAGEPTEEYVYWLRHYLQGYMEKLDAKLAELHRADEVAIEHAIDECGTYYEGAEIGSCRGCKQRSPLAEGAGPCDGLCPSCFLKTEAEMNASAPEEEETWECHLCGATSLNDDTGWNEGEPVCATCVKAAS